MEIFKFKSYKKYLKAYVKSLPNGGRGELTKISIAMGIHNTTLSQVLKGNKNINQEQGIELGHYLCLSESELNYLILLINYERAGTYKLKQHLLKQIEKEINKANAELSFREPPLRDFSEEVKGKFYSFWGYSGIRVLSSIKEYQTVDSIAKRARLSKVRTKEILDFLVENGLCELQMGKYLPGPRHTHINADDVFTNSHRLSWRAKAVERLGNMKDSEFVFSAPMSLSSEDFLYVRAQINNLVKHVIDRAKESEAEKAACLNIDWVEF